MMSKSLIIRPEKFRDESLIRHILRTAETNFYPDMILHEVFQS